ncbi:AraC family transcriptional regulator [Vineibacter terrae]|uniref:helix-turn-helix domain-containing protein n=1 Tax=Vineibacter terrae TaxID=2586908 RepID=UPI002E347D63|nr:AraC family transcriptional regulator [Vineibacter terrae]HEX2890310.1 AraC family transcriptional regulator [Vineibacter terrae]
MDESLTQIDLALRGAGMALACLLAALFGLNRARPALFGMLFALGVAGYLTCSWPPFAHTTDFWRWPIIALCIVVPALFWLFARALFEDDFQPGWREAGAVLTLLGLGAVMNALGAGPERLAAGLALRLYGLALVAHAIWIVVKGRAGDLVERRRRFRAPFVILSGLYVAMVGISEIILAGAPASVGLSALNALGILALTFVTMVYFTGLRPEVIALSPDAPAAMPSPSATTRHAAPVAPALPAEGDAVLARLRNLMDRERIYRTEGLTIGALADKLGMQEYVLRRLINGQLGHRNFTAFLNGYRLAEAKAALADPSQADVPILTIALDAGFASLGPFNRAFKTETGVTPSEFRRNALRSPASH